MAVQMELMMAEKNINDVELRKLSAGSIFKLSQLLEFGDGWKQLMGVIPVECGEGPLKYTHEHVKLIESAGKCQERPFSEILMEEWGTSGKKRPTVSFLLQCLLKAELYRAAEFVAVDLLNEPPPPRPKTGPAAPVKYPSSTGVTSELTPSAPPDITTLYDPSAPPPSSTQQLTQPLQPETSLQEVVPLPFAQLEAATEGFAKARLLGGGAGGFVYLAHLPQLGALAIKKFHDSGLVLGSSSPDIQLQFHNEVKVLAQLSHPNLLPLVGYSDNGPALCIAYRYMKNGSLLDRLACKDTIKALSWRLRVEIGVGAAQALAHLHSYSPKAIVHRDVKSANILLDENCTPKLGDFGLAREGSSAIHTQSRAQTKCIAGTAAYMSPEAQRGDVSVKGDVFSFGVVVLELLTGLSPYDESRSGHDLVTYVSDTNDNESLLDRSAGEWPSNVAASLYELAYHCLKDKRERPFMPKVIEKLNACL